MTDSALDKLREYDTGTIANAIDRLKLRPPTTGYSSTDVRCLFPDLGTVVGYAVTCREDTTTPRGDAHTSFEAVYRAIDAAGRPTIVVCEDVGTDRSRSCHLGDMMSTLMQSLGAVAFVTDGGVRDTDGIRQNAPGFQVFAAGAVPGAGESHVVEVGTNVRLGGMDVRPDDLIVGDANGLLSVPEDSIDDILSEAARVREREAGLVEFMHGPDFSLDGYMERRRG
jgi:4-hydroxy-4-methyl-2-oxoglutarate aldolase